MSVLRFTVPLFVFIYVGALFSIYPSIREALIDLDYNYDQRWHQNSPESIYLLEGHLWTTPARLATKVLPNSHWSAAALALLMAGTATLSVLSRSPSPTEWILHLGLALGAFVLASSAGVLRVHGMMMDGMTAFTPLERAIDAAWVLAFAIVLVLVGRDSLKERLRRRHLAASESVAKQ